MGSSGILFGFGLGFDLGVLRAILVQVRVLWPIQALGFGYWLAKGKLKMALNLGLGLGFPMGLDLGLDMVCWLEQSFELDSWLCTTSHLKI